MSEIIGNQTLPEGQEEPKIKFPCDYPIKILGEAEESFNTLVASIVLKHAPDFDVTTLCKMLQHVCMIHRPYV